VGQQDTRQPGVVSVGRICDTGEEGLKATGPRVSPGVCGRVAAGTPSSCPLSPPEPPVPPRPQPCVSPRHAVPVKVAGGSRVATKKLLQYLSFRVWLILLSIMISISIRLPASDMFSFFLVNNILLCVHVTFSLPIHPVMGTYFHSIFELLLIVS
jgi:hypothetical protein